MIHIKKNLKTKPNPTPLWLTLVWAGGEGGAGEEAVWSWLASYRGYHYV